MKTFAITLAVVLNVVFGDDVRLVNLDPPEAKQHIDKQDTTLKYAPKIESNVPAVRYLGNEPHNVVEDIYLANQYHGQDGLGGYLYGYAVPDIAKTERKEAHGDLRGAYNYIAGDGQEIKVEYWDDGTGFHQVDNVPKILPQDNDEVRAAKEEFLRIWQEEAERNSKPVQTPYNSDGQYASGPLSAQGQQQQQQQQQATSLINQYQQQKQQYPNPGQSVQYQNTQAGQHYQAQPSQTVNQYQQSSTNQQQSYETPPISAKHAQDGEDDGEYRANPNDDDGEYKPQSEEEQGPPKGFFYNFDYPVGIIVQKDAGSGGGVHKRESGVRDVYAANKEAFEQQLKNGGLRAARSSTGYLYVPRQ